MASHPSLPGITYPTRAERLDLFVDYKVFVDFWNPLTERLIDSFRALRVRSDASIVGIHAPQGAGKTMFTRQFKADYDQSREQLRAGISVNPENLWHRISSGGSLATELITESTETVDVLDYTGDEKWSPALVDSVSKREKPAVVLLDSAENVYFVRGLVDVPPADLIALRASGGVVDPAGEELVRLARNELAGTLLIVLTNNEDFLTSLAAEVERRHEGLMTVQPLPMPDSEAKEKAIRVNTNRLNKVSYWACLDRGGPDEKERVRERLLDATTFPGAFRAVDQAIASSARTRTGRPARRNLLTLILLTDDASAAIHLSGTTGRDNEVDAGWCASAQFDGNWAPRSIGQREAEMLESEWLLRVLVLGGDFVRALLSVETRPECEEACRGLLTAYRATLGGTSALQQREEFRRDIEARVAGWPDVADVALDEFWSRGANRSTIYEPALKHLFPSYNTGSANFLDHRPDLIVADFAPCSILSAGSKSAIPAAIQRTCHVFEFTATRSSTEEAITGYLDPKLHGYVRVTQES